jgi:hypothetical protein
MSVAINRMIFAGLISWPAFIVGARLGHDLMCSSNEDDITTGAFAGLILTNMALMTAFAAGAPPGRRYTQALVAATTSAILISGGFWIGVSTADASPCGDVPDSSIVSVALWGIAGIYMAIAGLLAWGITRLVVTRMNR